jgi:hypothetical protein
MEKSEIEEEKKGEGARSECEEGDSEKSEGDRERKEEKKDEENEKENLSRERDIFGFISEDRYLELWRNPSHSPHIKQVSLSLSFSLFLSLAETSAETHSWLV